MVGFQGWLGAQVVASNLQPGMITLHIHPSVTAVSTVTKQIDPATWAVLDMLNAM